MIYKFLLIPTLVCLQWLNAHAQDRQIFSESFEPIERPNILFIFADDIGYEALNCYGGLDFKTPNLDRMANEGIRFSRAHTSPVCTPSRVSMHTGLYVPRHGHTGVLPVHKGTDKKVDFAKFPTYAQQLRNNGYLTVTTGKWQLATLEVWPDHIKNAGFDHCCVWQIWHNNAKTLRHWNATLNRDGKTLRGAADQFGPDILNEYVIERMTEANQKGEPFLIVHNELLPHYPIIQTPADRDTDRPASLGNMIQYMDKLVGDLLDSVSSLGIRDNTYVIFMGDNGTLETDFKNPNAAAINEGPHTRHTKSGLVNGGKSQMNDAGSHVPLLFWGPKEIPAGTVCDELVDIVDLFPTILQLTDTKLAKTISNLDGRSIAAQIHGGKGMPRDWVHHELSWNKKRSQGGANVFDGQFRYHAKSGRLVDARKLPAEIEANETEPAVIEAKARLKAIDEQITNDSPGPLLIFDRQ